jgi:hypothetical protein
MLAIFRSRQRGSAGPSKGREGKGNEERRLRFPKERKNVCQDRMRDPDQPMCICRDNFA